MRGGFGVCSYGATDHSQPALYTSAKCAIAIYRLGVTLRNIVPMDPRPVIHKHSIWANQMGLVTPARIPEKQIKTMIL
jgi:hypothetical protein